MWSWRGPSSGAAQVGRRAPAVARARLRRAKDDIVAVAKWIDADLDRYAKAEAKLADARVVLEDLWL